MTTWQYHVNLDRALGRISLSAIGKAPLEGSVIPVSSGENPEIHLLRPEGEDWVFDNIVFSVFSTPTNTLTAQSANPPPLPITLYDFTLSPLVFDVILLSLGPAEISFSNANNLGANQVGAATIDFRIVIKASNVVYISQDPQLRDNPGG
ncbi:MAG: hypothetical protein V3T72_16500 [Thermoanaerobaculia bacterium]